MPKGIKEFVCGCLLAVGVLAGMVLFQYVGEQAPERPLQTTAAGG